MTVCFHKIIHVKSFDINNKFSIKLKKCKDFDGRDNFSIMYDQLIILTHNNIIYNKQTLLSKFNPNILKIYKNRILVSIKNILYKFINLNYNSITLYYNKYHIKKDRNIILKLKNLINYLNNI